MSSLNEGYLTAAAAAATGVEGVTPEEIWELVAMSCLSDDIPVSCNAGATGLPVCKAGCSGSGNIVWKLCGLLEVLYYCTFLSTALSLLMFAEFLVGPGTTVCDLVSQVLTDLLTSSRYL